MLSKCKKAIFGIGAFALAVSLQTGSGYAATITHGMLNSDDASGVIVDSSNGMEYTRLDSFNMTVDETQNAIGNNGAYDGWSIMTSQQVDGFLSSILGGTTATCTNLSSNGTACGGLTGWADAGFGASYNSTNDFFAFLGSGTNDFGLIRTRNDGTVFRYEDWGDAARLDKLGSTMADSPINLMLFREAAVAGPSVNSLRAPANLTAVPTPASGLLLLGALAGFGTLRRRRKSA